MANSAERLLRTLQSHQVRCIVIGAQAAVIHGVPIVTRDLEVTPSRNEVNLDRLVGALQEVDARPSQPRRSRVRPVAGRFSDA